MPFNLNVERNGYIYILATILLLGFFLRIYDLSKESLWRDEVYSIKIADLSLIEIFKNQETNPPLHSFVLHYWQKAFGDSAFSVRFPSLIFGILSILMTYQITAKLFNKQAALLSSLILCLSSFHIFYSQEARAYSLMVCLTLLSNLYYIKLLSTKKSSIILCYIIFSSLLTYSHVYGVFIIIAQNIHFLSTSILFNSTSRWKFKEWCFVQLAVLLLFVPWLNIFLSQTIGVVKQGFWIPEPGFKHLLATIMTYIGHRKLFWIYILCLPLSLVPLILSNKGPYRFALKINLYDKIHQFYKTEKKMVSNLFFLSLWFAVPIALPFIMSHFTTPIYHTRYTISASVALYILIAVVIDNINSRAIKTILICLVVGLSISHIWQRYFQATTREQWREAANFIAQNNNSTDLLIFSTTGSIRAFNYYSTLGDLPKIPCSDILDSSADVSGREKKGLVLSDQERIWAILDDFRKQENKTVQALLTQTHRLEKTKKLRGIEIYLFRNKHTPD